MVEAAANRIHAVNGVGPNYVLPAEMRVAVCYFGIAFDHVEGSVGLVSWVALSEGAAAAAVPVGGG